MHCQPNSCLTRNRVPVPFYKIANPNALFGGEQVYWGFTGSTGTYTNNQAVAIDKLPDQTKSTLKIILTI